MPNIHTYKKASHTSNFKLLHAYLERQGIAEKTRGKKKTIAQWLLCFVHFPLAQTEVSPIAHAFVGNVPQATSTLYTHSDWNPVRNGSVCSCTKTVHRPFASLQEGVCPTNSYCCIGNVAVVIIFFCTLPSLYMAQGEKIRKENQLPTSRSRSVFQPPAETLERENVLQTRPEN